MFVIRPAVIEDAPTLLKLARMVHFINLPADGDIIHGKIMRSRQCFRGDALEPIEQVFVFVLEDAETGNVVGTSQIIPCNSNEQRPFTFLTVRQRQHYSQDLQSGQVHVTVQLGTDTTGPTEIGGLILFPNYRGHPEKLGALLSQIRFHYMGLRRELFNRRVVAEMMGALTPDSRNLLWEYLGRRFINLSYTEADRFCQHSKEFMTSLFPTSEIYASLLPAEARSLIGKVGAETEPAKRMLEKLGFKFTDQVDPFDGGPYLEAMLDEIALVRSTRRVALAAPAEKFTGTAFASFASDQGFRGVRCPFAEQEGMVSIPAEVMKLLRVKAGAEIGITPLVEAASAARGGERKRVRAGT